MLPKLLNDSDVTQNIKAASCISDIRRQLEQQSLQRSVYNRGLLVYQKQRKYIQTKREKQKKNPIRINSRAWPSSGVTQSLLPGEEEMTPQGRQCLHTQIQITLKVRAALFIP